MQYLEAFGRGIKGTVVLRKMNDMSNCQNCGNPISGGFCQNCGMRITPIQTQYEQLEQPPTYQQEQPSPYQQQIHFIPDQQPTSPKKQGPPKRVIITIVIITAIIVVAIISVAMYGDKPIPDKPSNDFQDGHTFEMTNINTMKSQHNYEYSGDDARIERWSIDSFFGDNDGTVTSSEVEEYEDAYPDLVIGINSTSTTIDNEEGVYSQCNLSYDGATGDIDSGNPIFLTMCFTVIWTSIEENKISYSVKISICAYPTENFQFISPPGYFVSSVIGLDDVSYTNGKTDLIGTIYEGTPNWIPEYVVYITITKIGLQEPTPHSNLSFSEDSVTIGMYSGTFQGTINNSDVEIIALDSNLRIMVVLDLESETTIQMALYEFNITYSDTNNDSNLDPADEILITGGAQSDEIYIVYKLTGGIIANVTLD